MAKTKASSSTVWSIETPACIVLWGALLGLREIPDTAVFKTWGTNKISSLENYAGAGSATATKARAARLAFALDNQYVVLYGAKTEQGVTRQAAIQKMQTVLSDGNKTLAHLAKATDDAYDFWRQGETG